MELVYLWVEEYKNIEKQGFNFSPRFECIFYDEYEEDENGNKKLKDGCKLKIVEKIKKEDYVSIFPDNINVTAIVGENGSGKSNILEYLSYKNNEVHGSKKDIFIYKYNDEIQISNSIKCQINTSLQYNKFSENYPIILKRFHQTPKRYTLDEDRYIFNISDEVKVAKSFENLKEDSKDLRMLDILNTFESLDLVDFFNINKLVLPKDIILPKELFLSIFNTKENSLWGFNTKEFTQKMKSILQAKGINEEEINKFFNVLEDLDAQPACTEYEIKNISRKKLTSLIDVIKGFFSKNRELENELKFMLDIKLSSGTIEIMKLFSRITEVMYKIEKNEILVLLDEPETFYHPNWQKQIIKLLIDFFKINFPNYKVYIVLTSHSPLLLSDLPKENVIFLKKDADGKCKNVTKTTDIQTFGANIHTLLSHGFFMKDGLMGEFAKGKIEYIRKFYNKVVLHKNNPKYKTKYKCLYKKKQKDFEHIQKIIGEPFLKTIVKNQLEEIETILFENNAREMAIKRYIEEFGEDEIRKVLENATS